MTNLDEITQTSIDVVIEFYNEEQREILSHLPTYSRMQEIVSNGIKIPTSEFLTYYLFYKKRPGKPGYRNYSEISEKINKSWNDLEDFTILNDKSIVNAPDIEEQDKGIIEHIGESVSLSVINRIHGLSKADWDRLPQRGKPKKADFSIRTIIDENFASDNTNIIQVEAKGSSVENNMNKSHSIENQKSKLVNKKKEISNLEKQGIYPYPANIRYGSITAIDSRQNGELKCWLLDPDPDKFYIDPKRLRILNRIRFLRDWISFIGPRSQLASAISTRLAALESLENPFELDEIPLIKPNDEPFEFLASRQFESHYTWFSNKSVVRDEKIGGVVLNLSIKKMLFLGFREEFLDIAAKQDFQRILKYNTEPMSSMHEVECIISKSRFKDFKIPDNFKEKIVKKDNYIHFELKGQLHHSPEGIVFGILPMDIEEDNNKEGKKKKDNLEKYF